MLSDSTPIWIRVVRFIGGAVARFRLDRRGHRIRIGPVLLVGNLRSPGSPASRPRSPVTATDDWLAIEGLWSGALFRCRLDRMDREQELWACANMLLNRYGEDAWFHASQRADELGSQGDLRGQATFVAILRRIEQLTGEPTGPLN